MAATVAAASRSRGVVRVGWAGGTEGGRIEESWASTDGEIGGSPGDSESARGWPDSVRGRPRCMTSSQIGLHGQPQKMLK